MEKFTETLNNLIAVIKSLEDKIEDIIDLMDSIRTKNIVEGIKHNESYNEAILKLNEGNLIFFHHFNCTYNFWIDKFNEGLMHEQITFHNGNNGGLYNYEKNVFIERMKNNDFKWFVVDYSID